MARWLTENAPESDVVVSTRMRLARNLADLPFPSRLTEPEDVETVHELARQSVLKSHDFEYIRLSDADPVTKRALTERRIISSELSRRKNGGLIKSSDESISLMILEEDHFRLQSLAAGLAPQKAYNEVDLLDKMLSEGVQYAFREDLGFLTSCPTNAGTGLRASVMLHLPALAATKGIPRITAMIGKVGMTVRGAFGEGSAALGSFYQISNQVTLGVSEQEILQRLMTTAKTVIGFERSTRTELHRNLGIMLEDKIWRAAGVLKNARRMSDAEAQKLLSDLALGVSLGILSGITCGRIYQLMMDVRPAVIAEKAKTGTPQRRDIARADMIRKAIR